MRDGEGKVLYVGKAKNLRKRLASYFRKDLQGKTRALMNLVCDIETTTTENEVEALILENNLIKTHRPRFNILLRDDKTYPFIHISAHEFPRLSLHRGARKQGEFFGPYPNVQAARYSLEMLQKIFKMRQCRDSDFAHRSRPCLQYQIKRCCAPCVGLIDKKDYQQSVRATRDFLNGNSQVLQENLKAQMQEASAAQNYERAAMIRDQWVELQKLTRQQSIAYGDADADVLAVSTGYGEACVEVLFFRDGHTISTQAFYPKLPEQSDEATILSAFIAQFYLQRTPPPALVLSHTLEDKAMLEVFLTDRRKAKVALIEHPKAEKKRWLSMAKDNAKLNLSLHLSSKLSMAARFQALAQAFDLKTVPKRLECVDVSHTMGEYTVASCVVFDERGALKSDYRRYKIEGVTAGDDYAAMHQLLLRRFKKVAQGEGAIPDVFFVDGGRGQLKQAVSVLQELGIRNVQLIGVAKGEGRKAGLEKFYLPERKETIHLPSDHQAMHLIVHIRDEAHRFAIQSHRKGRDKKVKHSILETIAGVGAKRRRALIKHFGGMAMIQEASVQELAQVEGISAKLAQEIYETLHENN